jgi:DNA-binding GntR family transcriptional regulator
MQDLLRISCDTNSGRAAPRTLASAICEQLRSEILKADLLPGQKLNIALQAKRFSVSLAAVREALSRLVSDGLVEAVDQRGFRVRPVSPRDLRDLTRTRIEIDGLALRHSVESGGPDWERDVRAAHDRLTSLPRLDPRDAARHNDAWGAAHRDFHAALVGGCQSTWLRAFRTILHEQSERYRRLSVPLAQHDRDVEAEHRSLVDAVLARDVGRALEALADHYQRTTDIILSADVALLREDLAA